MAKYIVDTDAKKIIITDFVSKAELDKFIDDCNLHDYVIGAETPHARIIPIIDPIADHPRPWPNLPFYPDVMYSCNGQI